MDVLYSIFVVSNSRFVIPTRFIDRVYRKHIWLDVTGISMNKKWRKWSEIEIGAPSSSKSFNFKGAMYRHGVTPSQLFYADALFSFSHLMFAYFDTIPIFNLFIFFCNFFLSMRMCLYVLCTMYYVHLKCSRTEINFAFKSIWVHIFPCYKYRKLILDFIFICK